MKTKHSVCLLTLLLVIWWPVVAVASKEPPRLPANPESISKAPRDGKSFRFVAISDLNGSYGSTEYNQHVHAAIKLITRDLRPQLVISSGDLVAGQKRGLEEKQIWAMWDGFAKSVSGPLHKAGISFAPTAGNHDASGYPAFAHERAIFIEHWRKAEHKPPLDYVDQTNYPLYYTFRHKDAFFMVLDVTTMERIPAKLWNWMDEQLSLAQEDTLRFVTCHVPPYPIAHGREREIIPAPDNDRLRELFVKKNVDVFFTGHHHAYYKARKKGLNLVSLNCAGSGPRRLIGTPEPQRQSFVVVDVVDGGIAEIFTVQSDGKIFPDKTLPRQLQHGSYVVPRFDQK